MKKSEFDFICLRIQNTINIRNNILTFSYTVVLTVLGALFALEFNVSPWAYLFPFSLIVPFTGRIAYYRLWEERASTFLRVYAKKSARYYENERDIEIGGKGFRGTIIRGLGRCEMIWLSGVCVAAFYFNFFPRNCDGTIFSVAIVAMGVILPIVLFLGVLFINSSCFNPKKIAEHYMEEWIKKNLNNKKI